MGVAALLEPPATQMRRSGGEGVVRAALPPSGSLQGASPWPHASRAARAAPSGENASSHFGSALSPTSPVSASPATPQEFNRKHAGPSAEKADRLRSSAAPFKVSTCTVPCRPPEPASNGGQGRACGQRDSGGCQRAAFLAVRPRKLPLAPPAPHSCTPLPPCSPAAPSCPCTTSISVAQGEDNRRRLQVTVEWTWGLTKQQ